MILYSHSSFYYIPLFNIWYSLLLHMAYLMFFLHSILQVLEGNPLLQRGREIPTWLQEVGAREWGHLTNHRCRLLELKQDQQKGLKLQREMGTLYRILQMLVMTFQTTLLHLDLLIRTGHWDLLIMKGNLQMKTVELMVLTLKASNSFESYKYGISLPDLHECRPFQ